MRYVDPSGHSLFGDILGAIVGIIIAIYAPELLNTYLTFTYGAGLTAVSLAMIGGFVGGFVGALISTGSLSAALTTGLVSAITAGLLRGIGTQVLSGNWTTTEVKSC